MITHIAWYLLLVFVVLLVSVMVLGIVNPQALFQDGSKVVMREPGHRLLGPPQDVASQARQDVEFALISQAVYQRPLDLDRVKQGKALDPGKELGEMGWQLWDDFPQGDLKAKFAAQHLRLEVWSNEREKKVVVAFGGTESRNLKDWISDLRWFIPYRRDQYTLIVDEVGKEFVGEYLGREGRKDWGFLREATLHSTGHSLGGGLAQEFAYSMPQTASLRPVSKVYAFDPSPVTGFYSVQKELREYNSQALRIDRIYERGEILAIVRALTHAVAPPSESAPAIRQVRYNLFHTWNPFAGHSMSDFAFELHKASQPNAGSRAE